MTLEKTGCIKMNPFYETKDDRAIEHTCSRCDYTLGDRKCPYVRRELDCPEVQKVLYEMENPDLNDTLNDLKKERYRDYLQEKKRQEYEENEDDEHINTDVFWESDDDFN